MNKQKYFIISIVSILISIGFYLYLTAHYYDLHLGLSSTESICNVNSKFNCDAVAASKFSSIFGVPLALWGAVLNFFLLIIVGIAKVRMTTDAPRIERYGLYLSLASVFATIVMAGISYFAMPVYCLFCIGTYFLSLVNLFALWRIQEQKKSVSYLLGHVAEDLKASCFEFRWIGISYVLIPIVTFLAHSIYLDSMGANKLGQFVAESVESYQGQTINTFTEAGLVKGSPTAKVVLVEFADFLCPHCKHEAPTLKAFGNSHPDLKIIFKVFPLDGGCNPNPSMTKGDGARCTLAKAVVCGESKFKKGWELHDYIFENQEVFGLNPESNLMEWTKKNGSSWEDLKTCIDQEQVLDQVKALAQEGTNAQVKGTPSVFINGKKVDRAQLIPVLQKIYDAEASK